MPSKKRSSGIRWPPPGRLPFAFVAAILLSVVHCSTTRAQLTARQREAAYLATHPSIDPDVIAAIRAGHVIHGMDREQVTVIFGEPLRKKMLRTLLGGEKWMYQAERIHQNHFLSQGAALWAVIFVDGRVISLEPN